MRSLLEFLTGWTGDLEDKDDAALWEDDWDDDTVGEDDFSKQLKSELEKVKSREALAAAAQAASKK